MGGQGIPFFPKPSPPTPTNPNDTAPRLETPGGPPPIIGSPNMSGARGPGQAPDLPDSPAPPSPESDDPEVKRKTQEEMDAASANQRKSRGRASTILTSGLGIEDAPKLSRRVLLGS